MNPLNYGRGLLAELDDALTMHDEQLAAGVRVELGVIEADFRAALAPILDSPDPEAAVPAGFTRAEVALMRDRLDVALGVAVPRGGRAAARRTTAAAPAPEARPAG